MADSWDMAQLYDAAAARAVALCLAAGDPPDFVCPVWWRHMIRTVHRDVARLPFAKLATLTDGEALDLFRTLHRQFTHRPLAAPKELAHVQA